MRTMGGSVSIRVYSWSKPSLMHGNFGDDITLSILDFFGIKYQKSPLLEANFIATGSILDLYFREYFWRYPYDRFVSKARRMDDLHIWGSGFILPKSRLMWPRPTKIHSVRGELTAAALRDRGITINSLGDPGVLASRIIPALPTKTSEVVIVPHYKDYDWLVSSFGSQLPKHWKIVPTDAPVRDVLNAISASDLVISSSLHGLITADSYGIPCIWANTMKRPAGGTQFKYFDYASTRLREFNTPINYIDAINMGRQSLDKIASTALRNIELWQDEIQETFPFL